MKEATRNRVEQEARIATWLSTLEFELLVQLIGVSFTISCTSQVNPIRPLSLRDAQSMVKKRLGVTPRKTFLMGKVVETLRTRFPDRYAKLLEQLEKERTTKHPSTPGTIIVTSKGRRARPPGPPASDYLKPDSNKYEMPEIDLE